MTVKGQNIEVYQGDNKNIIITVYDENGSLLDLTGYNAVWCVYKQTPYTILVQKTSSAGITIPSPTSGEINIALEQVDTADLVPNDYGHQCEVEDAFGNHATVTVGYLKLLKSITHSAF